MRILLISGSRNTSGATAEAISFSEKIIYRSGAEAVIYTAPESVRACTGCGYCKKNGGCVFADLTELYEKAQICDSIMIFTPIHYLGASPSLTSVLSRLFMSKMSVVKGKPAAVIAVGRRAGGSSAIADIFRFFTFSASPIANSTYPAIYYGYGDAEGRESVELITDEIIWLTRSLSVAKECGIDAPELTRKCKTDLRSTRTEG